MQSRKTYVPRTFNQQGTTKNYSQQHYNHFNQPIQDISQQQHYTQPYQAKRSESNYNPAAPNGATGQRVPVGHQGYHHSANAPPQQAVNANPHLRGQASHPAVHQGGQHPLHSVATSGQANTQNLGISNQVAVPQGVPSGVNTVTTTNEHGVQAIQQLNATTIPGGVPPNVPLMYSPNGGQHGQAYFAQMPPGGPRLPPQVISSYYLPPNNFQPHPGMMQIGSSQFQSMATPRPQYGTPVQFAQQPYVFAGTPHGFPATAQTPQQAQPTQVPPKPRNVPPPANTRVKNPIKIINPDTMEEVDVNTSKGSSEEISSSQSSAASIPAPEQRNVQHNFADVVAVSTKPGAESPEEVPVDNTVPASQNEPAEMPTVSAPVAELPVAAPMSVESVNVNPENLDKKVTGSDKQSSGKPSKVNGQKSAQAKGQLPADKATSKPSSPVPTEVVVKPDPPKEKEAPKSRRHNADQNKAQISPQSSKQTKQNTFPETKDVAASAVKEQATPPKKEVAEFQFGEVDVSQLDMKKSSVEENMGGMNGDVPTRNNPTEDKSSKSRQPNSKNRYSGRKSKDNKHKRQNDKPLAEELVKTEAPTKIEMIQVPTPTPSPVAASAPVAAVPAAACPAPSPVAAVSTPSPVAAVSTPSPVAAVPVAAVPVPVAAGAAEPVASPEPTEQLIAAESSDKPVKETEEVSSPTEQDDTTPDTAAPTTSGSVYIGGVLTYSRDFLLNLQRVPLCMQKPTNLPTLEVIKTEPHAKPYDQKQMLKMDFFPFQQGGGGGGGGNHARGSQQNYNGNRSRRNDSQRGGENRPTPHMIPQPKVLNIAVDFAQKTFKNKAKQPWKVVRSEVKADMSTEEANQVQLNECTRKIRAILNKLTPDNFESSLTKVKALELKRRQDVEIFATLVFEKATLELSFAEIYTKLVKCLVDWDAENAKTKQKPELKDGGKPTNIKLEIIGRCQEEFEREPKDEKRSKYEDEIEKTEADLKTAMDNLKENPTDEKLKQQVLSYRSYLKEAQDMIMKVRKSRKIGNVVFIAELYKAGQINGKVILSIIEKLIKKYDDSNNEVFIECVCKLVSILGKMLTQKMTPEPKATFDEMFERIRALAKSSSAVGNRTRCVAMDLVDLRSNNWVPRQAKQGPVRIKEIQDQARAEHAQADLQKHTDKMDNYNYQPKNRQPASNPNEWSTAGPNAQPNKRVNERFDISKFGGSRHLADQLVHTVELRPTTANWGGGSSGGLSTSARFSVLEDSAHGDRRQQSQKFNRPQAVTTRSTPGPTGDKSNFVLPKRSSNADRSKSSSRSRETVRGAPTQAPLKPKLSEDEAQNCTLAAIQEYCQVELLNEALLDINNKFGGTDENMLMFVKFALEWISDQKLVKRQRVAKLFSELLKAKVLTVATIVEGTSEFMEFIDDIKIDCPGIGKDMGEFYGALIRFSADFTMDSLAKALGSTSACIAEILSVANQDEQIGSGVNLRKHLLHLFRTKTEKEEVIEYIKTKVTVDKKSKGFIRDVTTAMMMSCLNYDGAVFRGIPADFEDKVEDRYTALQVCIDNKPANELQCLFALQALSVQLQHPNNIFRRMLDALDAHDVIVEETVLEWVKDDTPEEQEGKGVCVASANTYLHRVNQCVEDAPEHS